MPPKTTPNSYETDITLNPRMQRLPQGDLMRPSRKTNGIGVQAEDTRICVVMVGLPARGKSLIAGKGISHCFNKYGLDDVTYTARQSFATSTGSLYEHKPSTSANIGVLRLPTPPPTSSTPTTKMARRCAGPPPKLPSQT